MLVLSRKQGEVIEIGDNVKVTIVSAGANRVRVGITAPKDVHVKRGELDDDDNTRGQSGDTMGMHG
jgi:carbon storage regulator